VSGEPSGSNDPGEPEGPPHRTLANALAEAERLLRSGSAPDAAQLDELAQLASADPVRANRLRKRLSRVFAFAQLRAREVPERWLDGLYDDVYAASSEPLGRSRMSLAFLDAPRSLQRWRQTAVAACLLLAVGVGWNATRDTSVVDDTAGVHSLYDLNHPLNGVLERVDADADVPESTRDGTTVPVANDPWSSDSNLQRSRRGRSPFGGRVWFRIGNARGNVNGVMHVERKGGQEEN